MSTQRVKVAPYGDALPLARYGLTVDVVCPNVGDAQQQLLNHLGTLLPWHGLQFDNDEISLPTGGGKLRYYVRRDEEAPKWDADVVVYSPSWGC